MRFECIKTVEHPPGDKYFIEGHIYTSLDEFSSRTMLYLKDEHSVIYNVASHWLHWSFNKWYKEHFIRIN
jgi:hypothetical protein